MFDQDYAVLGVLMCTMLLVALVVPAPKAPPRNEGLLHLIFLGAGTAFAILTGIMGLAQLPQHGAVGMGLAWLSVMPCVWMSRAPRPGAEEWEDAGEDDGGGGEPSPQRPGAPPAPDGRRPRLAPAPPRATAAAPSLVAPARAPIATPAATAPATPAATPEPAPAATPHRRRLEPRPRLARGDHRSIAHIRAATHDTGRRRRANLRHRVLRRCRELFWVD